MNITYKETVGSKEIHTNKTLDEIVDLIRSDSGIKKKISDIMRPSKLNSNYLSNHSIMIGNMSEFI